MIESIDGQGSKNFISPQVPLPEIKLSDTVCNLFPVAFSPNGLFEGLVYARLFSGESRPLPCVSRFGNFLSVDPGIESLSNSSVKKTLSHVRRHFVKVFFAS